MLNTRPQTIPTIVDDIFDWIKPETFIDEMLDILIASLEDSEFDHQAKNKFRSRYSLIQNVQDFLLSLHQNKGSRQSLKQAVKTFLKATRPNEISFEFWEIYVSAIGSDEADHWNGGKRSNIAFTIQRLSKFLFDLELLQDKPRIFKN